MGQFVDHPKKVIIRENWCMPILKFLSEESGHKLVYFGLPGIQAYDLLAWINYLEYVIAVDCGYYNKNGIFNEDLAKRNIKKLSDILNQLERSGKIRGYSLYYGYIEEVVLRGYDKNFQMFQLSDAVHVFNLDFCNSLTVPLRIHDIHGNEKVFYKNEVIKKLLEIQKNWCIEGGTLKFLMFITVNSMFWEDEANSYFEGKSGTKYSEYLNKIELNNWPEKNLLLLRYYLYDVIMHHFSSCEFCPRVLPSIKYTGIGKHQLVCFTILGKFHKTAAAVAPIDQDISDIANRQFLTPGDSEIEVIPSEFLDGADPDPLSNLKMLNFFK